jgi:hypothetical protein
MVELVELVELDDLAELVELVNLVELNSTQRLRFQFIFANSVYLIKLPKSKKCQNSPNLACVLEKNSETFSTNVGSTKTIKWHRPGFFFSHHHF